MLSIARLQEWDDEGGDPDRKKRKVKEATLDLNRRLRQELATPATIHFYTNQVCVRCLFCGVCGCAVSCVNKHRALKTFDGRLAVDDGNAKCSH